MSRYCVVTWCMNRRPNENVSFFTFPKDKTMRYEWLQAIDRLELLNDPDFYNRNYVVCSEHFDESMMYDFYRRKLTPDAVPTLHIATDINTFDVATQTDISCINEAILIENASTIQPHTQCNTQLIELLNRPAVAPLSASPTKRNLHLELQESNNKETEKRESASKIINDSMTKVETQANTHPVDLLDQPSVSHSSGTQTKRKLQEHKGKIKEKSCEIKNDSMTKVRTQTNSHLIELLNRPSADLSSDTPTEKKLLQERKKKETEIASETKNDSITNVDTQDNTHLLDNSNRPSSHSYIFTNQPLPKGKEGTSTKRNLQSELQESESKKTKMKELAPKIKNDTMVKVQSQFNYQNINLLNLATVALQLGTPTEKKLRLKMEETNGTKTRKKERSSESENDRMTKVRTEANTRHINPLNQPPVSLSSDTPTERKLDLEQQQPNSNIPKIKLKIKKASISQLPTQTNPHLTELLNRPAVDFPPGSPTKRAFHIEQHESNGKKDLFQYELDRMKKPLSEASNTTSSASSSDTTASTSKSNSKQKKIDRRS